MSYLSPEDGDWLLTKSDIEEQPFSSSVPLIGPAITWFRTRWNNVATRWYVQPMVRQQNEFNSLLAERIRDFETYTYTLSSEQDRDLVQMRHDVAALQHQLRELNQRLKALDDYLTDGTVEPDET